MMKTQTKMFSALVYFLVNTWSVLVKTDLYSALKPLGILAFIILIYSTGALPLESMFS